MLEHEHLANAVVLVLANKQDLKVRSVVRTASAAHCRRLSFAQEPPAQDAMSVQELSEVLSLHTVRHHDWHIQAACALTGEGLHEGLEWIAQRVAHLPAGS